MVVLRASFTGFIFALFTSVSYANIVFDGRFSNGDFSTYRAVETDGISVEGAVVANGIPDRLERVLDPAGSGKWVGLAELHTGDVQTHGGRRSEISAFLDPVGSERWYSWGYYLPETWEYGKGDTVIAQIHSVPDKGESGWRNPPLAFFVTEGELRLVNAYDSDDITSPLSRKPIAGLDFERRELTSWKAEPETWTYLDLHVKWAADNTGFLELWKDGVLFFQEDNQANTFDDEAGVWFKNGIYDVASSSEFISAYSTGVLIGDEKETFQSMSMSVAPEPSTYLMMMAGLASIGLLVSMRTGISKQAEFNT